MIFTNLYNRKEASPAFRLLFKTGRKKEYFEESGDSLVFSLRGHRDALFFCLLLKARWIVPKHGPANRRVSMSPETHGRNALKKHPEEERDNRIVYFLSIKAEKLFINDA